MRVDILPPYVNIDNLTLSDGISYLTTIKETNSPLLCRLEKLRASKTSFIVRVERVFSNNLVFPGLKNEMKVSLADFGPMPFKVHLLCKILQKSNDINISTSTIVKAFLSENNHENITQPEDTRFEENVSIKPEDII